MSDADRDHDAYLAERVIRAFDRDPIAQQFLREDGQGGFAAGIGRMAREIERLRTKCGEPNHRPEGWEDEEEALWDAEEDLEILKMQGGRVQ